MGMRLSRLASSVAASATLLKRVGRIGREGPARRDAITLAGVDQTAEPQQRARLPEGRRRRGVTREGFIVELRRLAGDRLA